MSNSAMDEHFARLLDLIMEAPRRTPFYVYDVDSALSRLEQLKTLVGDWVDIYYAVKANPNIRLLSKLLPAVDGVDVASFGEVEKAIESGFDCTNISFAGPGKTTEELEAAVKNRIGVISIESFNELLRLEEVATKHRSNQDVVIRINPKTVIKEFALKMGGGSSPFGIDQEEIERVFTQLEGCKHLTFKGIHVYAGTQCLKSDALAKSFESILNIALELEELLNVRVDSINFGGGFGIPYFLGDKEVDPKVPLQHLRKILELENQGRKRSLRRKAIIELGRYIIGEFGLYVTKITDKKISRGKEICILDGGLNHHLAATGNFGQVIRRNYKLVNLTKYGKDCKRKEVDVVGPLCTSIDKFGTVELDDPEIGDWIGIENSGAYAYSASPKDFLSHRYPDEYIISNNNMEISN